MFYALNVAQTNCTGKNKRKPDVDKVSACAFVPCPMATCALKCGVVCCNKSFCDCRIFVVIM